MIYIVFGDELVFVEDKIKQITKDKENDIVKINCLSPSFSVEEITESCLGNSLFSNGNVVMVKDPPFLCKKYDENELKGLYEYCANPIYETDLIFYTLDNSFNRKLKAYKQISSNAQVIECNMLDYKSFNIYLERQINFEKLNIDRDAITQLNIICKRSATLLKQNLDVLKNYPDKITTDVINKLCSSAEVDSFEIINAITNKNITRTIDLSRKVLNQSDSILSLVNLLAGQLRFLYNIAYLDSIGKKSNEIMDIMSIKSLRYNKAREALQKLNLNQIINLLDKLSKIDIKCKSDNSLPQNDLFELFIIDLMN